MQEISFDVDGQKLYVNLFYPKIIKEKAPGILFIHGWTSSTKSPSTKGLPDAFTKLGFICMTFDMRGHGESDGDINLLTRQNFLDDVLAAYDFLTKQKNVDIKNISLVGASFGAYLAARVSNERKVSNLVLRVPANYPNESFNEPQINYSGENNPDVLFWRFKALGKEKTYALDALSKFSGNILIIESEKDNLVPHQTIMNYVDSVSDRSKLQHVVMEGAGHAFREEKFVTEYAKIVLDWFKKRL